jgi:predicted MFS family arabinose efflux permease
MLFFFMGLSTGTMDVAMNAQAVVVEQAARKPIMSFFHAIFSAGMMAGAGAGALFTHFEVGLRLHLFTVSVASVLLVIWAIGHLVADAPHTDAKAESPFRVPDASLVGIGLIAFCSMLGEGAMADWSTNYMLNVAKAEPGFAPVGLAVFSMAMMVARFGGDTVRARLGDRSLLISCSLIALSGLGLILVFPHPWMVLVGLLFVGLGLSVIVPIAYSTAGNVPGMSPGVGIGMVTTIGYTGFLFGPPIIGFLADWQGLRVALLFTLGLFVLMTALSVRFRVMR